MQEGRLTLRAAMRFRSQRWATACSGSTPLIAKVTNPEETRRSVVAMGAPELHSQLLTPPGRLYPDF